MRKVSPAQAASSDLNYAADRLRGAGVDKWARAEEKASDHAPTWVVLA